MITTAVKIYRYVATQLENKLYTIARAAKILGLKRNDIEFVVAINNEYCLVGLFNESVKIHKSEFIKLLVADRQKRTHNLTATENAFNPLQYTVRNLDRNSTYQVKLQDDHIICECQDYENLVKDFGTNKVACKHVFKVLSSLGFGSLRDYLHDKEQYNEQQYQRYLQEQDYQHLRYSY